jgi:protein SCO1/2
MTKGRARWLLAAAAVCAALAGFWFAQQLDRGSPRLASGTWLPQAKAVPDFQLTDTLGRAFTRQDLKGAPTLMFFGFTRCPDVCPGTLVTLAQVRKRAALARLRVLFVSIDPEHDSPALLAAYVHAFDPEFQGLTGDPAVIRTVASSFGVAVNRVELPGGDYTMDHSAVVFLLDAAARIAAIFTPPYEVATLAADLKRAAPYLTAGQAAGAGERPAS